MLSIRLFYMSIIYEKDNDNHRVSGKAVIFCAMLFYA